MKTYLIADSGSTKADWALVNENGERLLQLSTSGINVAISSEEALSDSIKQVVENCNNNPDNIFFYGAGCIGELSLRICSILKSFYPESSISVNSDMLGAARALFGYKKGIACILGTGSNSCVYDGNDIVSQIPSLGYILGDEGSGATFGKILLNRIFKKRLGNDIINAFFEEYNLSVEDVIRKVYREERPNRFLASLVPFIAKNLNRPEINEMVVDEFMRFFKNNVMQYVDYEKYEIGFVGSIAFFMKEQLETAAHSCGLPVSQILHKPIDQLINFHVVGNRI